MNTKYRRGVFRASLFGLFVILLLTAFSLNTVAEEPVSLESDWIGKNLKSEILESEPYDDTKEYGPALGRACVSTKVYTRNLADALYDDEKTLTCAKKLPSGAIVDKEYIKEEGLGIAGRHNSSKTHQVVKGADAVLVKKGREVALVDNYFAKTTKSFNILSGRLIYDTSGNTLNTIVPKTGAAMLWKDRTISAEAMGRYYLIKKVDSPFIRYDPETKEAVSFGRGTFAKSGGTNRKPKFVHLTFDGRYALVGENKSRAYLYDLESCPNTMGYEWKDHQAFRSPNCEYISIVDYLQIEYPDYRNPWIENIEFDNARQIAVVFGAKDADGNKFVHTARIAPDDVEFVDDKPSYIALGDSYASGEGDMDDSWYELGTNVPENKCHLSRRSYPYLLAEQLNLEEFHSVACSGAKYDEVRSIIQKNIEGERPNNDLGIWYPGVKPQLKYLVDEYSSPSIVTISIGGNDAGFASKLQECVIGPGTCKYAENSAYRSYVAMEIASLHDSLRDTYQEIVAQTEQNTKIYAVGYPQFVKDSGGSCGLNVGLNGDERVFINKATTYINRVIKAAAIKAGIYYLDIEDSLDGANLCSLISDQEMAVNGITMGDDVRLPRILSFSGPVLATLSQTGIGKESYHPNQNGHQLMQQRISALTADDLLSFDICDDGSLVCPNGARSVPIPDADYWGNTAVEFAQLYGANPHQNLPDYPRRIDIIKENLFDGVARRLKVSLSNLQPGSLVNFILNSDPVDLGSYRADENGVLEVTLEIPEGIEVGMHTLSASTKNIIGEEKVYYEPVIAYELSDLNEHCGLIAPSGTDVDHDNIDDACDGYYEEYVDPTEEAGSSQDSGDVESLEDAQDTTDEIPAEIIPVPSEQVEAEPGLQINLPRVTFGLNASPVQNTLSTPESRATGTDGYQADPDYGQAASASSIVNKDSESRDAEETLGTVALIDDKGVLVDASRNNDNFIIWIIVGLVGSGVAIYTINSKR